ncbi:hypothetical protein PHYPSEUDO_010507 [Phytophthora pseudosyringae]|uniref:Polycystin cation channel PKD1/PKD2 domain-containing protein n=1 Tax=Phytophthora pseudosyringae TaxID=221518 RepID=A0A8T1WCK5_9STRA|nr:hypothetical protein PHYPSEUDO_010507 [Phytophthora pseudosyringae]
MVHAHPTLSPDPYDSTAEYQADSIDSPKTCAELSIPVGTALNKLWRDEKHAADMKEIIVAMTSFCIFVAAMFLHIPATNMYYQTSNALSPGSERRSVAAPSVKFVDIETVPDIFDWLNDSFVPQVFVTEDYNGKTLPEDEWGRIGSLNALLGAVSFHVTRMAPNKCNTPDFLDKLYPSCYDESSTRTDELLIPFDTNATGARAILAKKKATGDWLTLATQHLMVTILTINGELPGYAVTKLLLVFNPGGYIEPSSSTTSTLLDQYAHTRTIALDTLVILWFCPWMLISALISVAIRYKNMSRESSSRHLHELLRHAGLAIRFWAFPDGWFAIDALRGPTVYAYYITVVITHSAMTNSTFRGKLSALRDVGQSEGDAKATLSSVTNSLEHIAKLTVLLRLLATTAVFVLGLRVLNTFRDHFGLSILTRTIASAVRSFRTFSVIFAVIFVAFAATGTVLFGNSVGEFSSLLNATKTCVNMLFNNFDVKTIGQIDFSVAYYWSYMSLMTFVLLNIVLAIVVEAYKMEKDKKDKSKCWVFRRVLNHVVRHWLAPVCHVLTFCLCRAPSRRDSVVFWGRIRSRVLLEALTDRLGVMPLEWSPETKLTPRLLKTLFPDASIHECEATMKHLTTKSTNQDCCPASEETDLADDGVSQRCILLTSSTRKSLTENKRDSCCCTGIDAETHDLKQVTARLDVLEQKLDFLIEKLTRKGL